MTTSQSDTGLPDTGQTTLSVAHIWMGDRSGLIGGTGSKGLINIVQMQKAYFRPLPRCTHRTYLNLQNSAP